MLGTTSDIIYCTSGMKQVTSQFLDVLYEEKNGKPVVTTMTFFFLSSITFFLFTNQMAPYLHLLCVIVLFFILFSYHCFFGPQHLIEYITLANLQEKMTTTLLFQVFYFKIQQTASIQICLNTTSKCFIAIIIFVWICTEKLEESTSPQNFSVSPLVQ